MAEVLTFLLQLLAVCFLGVIALLILYIIAVLTIQCVKKLREEWKK